MELNKLSIKEAVKGLKDRKFSSVELTKSCLDAISKYENYVKAFVTVLEESSLAQAKLSDDLIRKEGEDAFILKPLLGIPYACKDNFCTKGVETTASSNILKGFIPPYESTVTKKLKEAGTVLLGKTNLDAFAHGSSTETSDFFTTRNPWDLSRVPGGSSGGSAAAVSANMCIFAIGSETAGSIRGPASWCGITGLKPTYGRVSRYGLIAMASSTDSPGPLTKTVEDSALILSIISGKDQLDATTSTKAVPNYLTELRDFDIKGLKIGRPKSYFGIDVKPGLQKGVKAQVNEAIKTLEEMGAEIVEMDLIPPKYSIAVYTILQRSEVSSNLARFDGIRYGQPRSSFGFEAKKRMMLGAYALSSGYYDEYYAKAQKVRTLVIEDFNKAFGKVDLIVSPTYPCVATKIGESDNSAMFGELMDVFQEPSSIAGLPGISVPCGFHEKLPVGIQFVGPHISEPVTLGVAYQFQQNTNFHLSFPNLEGDSK